MKGLPARLSITSSMCMLMLGALIAVPAAASADVFEPISLISVGRPSDSSFVEQAGVAEHPAISADGRYVAFDGVFGGVKGVWRAELLGSAGSIHPGSIEQVAGGDAELPSISGNGQYISFTTNEGASLPAITNGQPDEHPQQEAVNVYVRDMSTMPSDQGAFTPASAVTVNGEARPLTYGNNEGDTVGAVAVGRSAISENGRYVAFVTTAESDLTDPGGAPITPALQVAIRDLVQNETRLVSTEYGNGKETDRPVSTQSEGRGLEQLDGAAYQPVPFPARGVAASTMGAAISADGSTVAWMGREIARQAPTLEGPERETNYTEPLWREVGDGALGPTRAITGGGDPASSACIESGETQPLSPVLSDPCQGPFSAKGELPVLGIYSSNPGEIDIVPRLSGNGQTVVFLASQLLISAGEEFKNAETSSNDLYIANMANGLTRVQALRQLTELAGGNSNLPGETARITDLNVSSDGTEVAFTTERTTFPLGSPAYVSIPAVVPQTEELYAVDLADDTLTRITHGYEGEGQQSESPGQRPQETEAGSPSFSADGDTVAFSSAAANLVYGEGNKANSVFAVSRKQFEAEAISQYISPEPQSPNLAPAWMLTVTPRSRANGSVLLEVETPGAGRLGASAEGAVRVAAVNSSVARRGGRQLRDVRRASALGVANRRVASAAKSVRGEGLATLTLTPISRYRSLATRRGGFSTSVSIVFAAPGHATLRQTIPVMFRHIVHAAHHSKRHVSGTQGRQR
jgi:Tol biopolymer transport system component